MNPVRPLNANYDLVIIGSGPGGYVAGLYASRHKLKTCVIEKDLIGGTCLNRGCIPTKALLHSASLLSKIKESKEFGVEIDGFRINFGHIASRKDAIVARLRAGIETLFRANNIDYIKGAAAITGPDTVSVNGNNISAKYIIIGVGARPAAIPGIIIDEVDMCSSDGILAAKVLPKSVAIVGGGVIGCEFANLFNALGSRVFIIELLDRILPTQSREVSRKMEAILRKRGVIIHVSARLESVTKASLRALKGRSPSTSSGLRPELIEGRSTLLFKTAEGQALEVDKALISVGRIPNTESLGLDKALVKTEKGRIIVDENLRTSVKNIFAVGDCVGGPLLAHKASYDGILAVDNIIGNTRSIDYSVIPNCIWTDPEIASVGLSEEGAKAVYPDVKIARFPYLASGKAYLMGRTEGFIKIIGDSKGNILGVEILGEGACDLIGEAVLAKTANVNIRDWARVVHGHPTLSEVFQEAAHVFCGMPIHSV